MTNNSTKKNISDSIAEALAPHAGQPRVGGFGEQLNVALSGGPKYRNRNRNRTQRAKRRVAAALASILSLGLLGCAGTESATPAEATHDPYAAGDGEYDPSAPVEYPTWKESDGPATWQCMDYESGVKYTFSLPNDDSREQIRLVESLRKRANITEPVSYLWIDIDATQAVPDPESGTGVYQVSWATADFNSAEATSVSERISDWRSQYVDVNNTDLYNEFIRGGNSLLNTAPHRGAKGFELMVTDDPITSMVNPAVYPSIFASAPCVLEGE